jgi:hypothetical protein
MGGSSKSSSSQHSSNSQTSIVNDGDYAGASNFTVDESEYNYEFRDESDNSMNYEDNREDNREYNYDYSQEIDQSQEWEVDNSLTDNREIDNSFTDESDHSINDSYNTTLTNDGEFAGVQGNVTVLDGGAIEGSFDFAAQASSDAADVAKQANSAMAGTATNAMITAENMVDGGFNLSRDTLTEMREATADYSASLSLMSEQMNETIAGVTRDAISNANTAHATNLATVADVAQSATTGGQAVVADASVAQVKYIAIAVAVGLAAMALRG